LDTDSRNEGNAGDLTHFEALRIGIDGLEAENGYNPPNFCSNAHYRCIQEVELDTGNNLEKILESMKGEKTKVIRFPSNNEVFSQNNVLTEHIPSEQKHYFVPELLSSAWIPRKSVNESHYKRHYGGLLFVSQTGLHDDGSEVGLPSGLIPRKILARLATISVINRSPVVDVRSVAYLLEQTNLTYNGQMVKRIREQILKLAYLNVSIRFTPHKQPDKRRVFFGRMFDELELAIEDNQLTLFPNKIRFSESFFESMLKDESFAYFAEEVQEMKSSLQHDIYLWLVRRTGRLVAPVQISWEMLHPQFANSESHSMRDFRRRFREALKAVVEISGQRVDSDRKGITIHPQSKRKFHWFSAPNS